MRSPDSLVNNKAFISEENRSEYSPPSQNVVNVKKAIKIPLKVKIKRVADKESMRRDDSFEPMVKLVDSLEQPDESSLESREF